MKWVWSERCQEALAHVKAMLSSPPACRAPDFQLPFLLAVHACDVGVGAVVRGQWPASQRSLTNISKHIQPSGRRL